MQTSVTMQETKTHNVDDATEVLLLHLRDDCSSCRQRISHATTASLLLTDSDGAQNICVEGFGVIVEVDFERGLILVEQDGRVVDQHVDPLVLLENRVNACLDALVVVDIEHNERHCKQNSQRRAPNQECYRC